MTNRLESRRTRVLRNPAVAAARTAAALATAPVLRRRIARADHAGRLEWVRRLIPGSHGQKPEEIIAFAELVAPQGPERLCEIGTLRGGTSLFLCGIAPTLRTYVGIDIEVNNARLVDALSPSALDVTFIEGSSRDESVRGQLARSLGGQLLDVLFIDGDHEYAGVRADLLEYRDLVRPGGLIAFHDIVPDHGVSYWAGGVPQLWTEIRDRFRHWEYVREPGQDAFGIGVIEHDPDVELR